MVEDVAVSPKKKRGCLFYGGIGLGVLVVLYLIGDAGMEQAADERSAVAAGAASGTMPVVDVTARDLHAAFEANEVAAQSTYGDKRLRVSGTISSVALDFADDPFLVLETANQFQGVHAGFTKAEASAIAALTKGQKVTVICDDLSEAVGTPMLDECALGAP